MYVLSGATSWTNKPEDKTSIMDQPLLTASEWLIPLTTTEKGHVMLNAKKNGQLLLTGTQTPTLLSSRTPVKNWEQGNILFTPCFKLSHCSGILSKKKFSDNLENASKSSKSVKT